ncbi:MAG: sensor domain-containing protein [Alphaproteobacteria bacterium]|nr:sensor domain-containing protein [Alphaproteobacteria bacterium]MDE1986693.1 sensor domain-containing protein [Alphaproteobacteria bacterium]MDE2161932.1 sensor domain-containing protein [Alphaproteobacteria bacterium]MDE2264480.1 sensor domain-containing protein [Alphaproteobacteria bacterium]MDE2498978.1 sensor domain-containing protein [Alphaproteobacteria bacterium]
MNSSQAPETVRAYLDQLRRALKGAPPGLIADALADCEEHLNNEIAQNPDQDEASVLASVVETYGSPQEIAEEYRDMEATISTPFPKQDEPIQRRLGFFNVISDPRTYGALLYMLLSLITGIFYFTWTITGISLTAGFAILILGIPFALLFVGSIRLLSHVEGRIVEGLLGVRMPRRMPPTTAPDESIFTRIKEALIDMRTWTSMFYLLLMLPLGIIYFVVAVVGLSVSIGVSGGAIYGLITNHSNFQVSDVPWLDHLLHTAPGLFLVAAIGLLLFFVVLHIARAVGWMHGRIAEGLLVRL